VPAGRPTKLTDQIIEQAHKLALLGLTDVQMADVFDVNESTIHEWKKASEEFSESIKSGKEFADARVAKSLYHRALGYSHPEDKIFNDSGIPLIIPTIKHYPPDPTACIFWLKNRQKEIWRDKQEHEHTGKDGSPLVPPVIKIEFVKAKDGRPTEE
jgi:hypothetical protein